VATKQKVNARTGYDRNIEYSKRLEEQIRTQRGNVLISVAFTFCVFSVSLVATLYLFRTGISGIGIEYVKLGPIALSSISLPLPLRMYLSYRVRLPIYRRLKHGFEVAAKLGVEPDPELVDDARTALKALHKPD
jgi:hypothetical protein